MTNVPRKADGRRVFSAEFKRTQVQRILTGEKTLAELSREISDTMMWGRYLKQANHVPSLDGLPPPALSTVGCRYGSPDAHGGYGLAEPNRCAVPVGAPTA